MTSYFCDGLKEVSILNGVARLEFQRLEPIERGGNREFRPVTELVVALPVQGLVNLMSVLENVRDRLVAQGALAPAGAAGGGAPPEPAKSPNFS
ncbi:MAG TPA: hypothetical protein VMB84_15815 [Stellaceae bacterium]|nr:hypothetical protein [Stellaceae bacterium]